MATERQIAANRRNAEKSTGPRTDAGKAAVSSNAVRHGLRSDLETLERVESPNARYSRSELLARYRDELGPGSALEELAVRRLAQMEWRLRCLEAAAERIAAPPGADLPGIGTDPTAPEAELIVDGLLKQGSAGEALFRISEEQLRLQRGLCRMHDRLLMGVMARRTGTEQK